MSTRFFFFICIVLALFTTQCNTISGVTNGSTTTNKGNTSHTSSSTQLRQNIVDYAKQQEGVKYNYGGRSPRGGFDCSGLMHFVYNEFDISLTPVSRVQETEGRKISINEVQTGDLVFFRKSRGGSVFHVALVVSNTREGISVIHSTTSRGVIIENISKSSYWQPKLSSARTFLPR